MKKKILALVIVVRISFSKDVIQICPVLRYGQVYG
jgi:hypothetical protein